MIQGQPVNDPELRYVEFPFLHQLGIMGWQTYEGYRDNTTLNEWRLNPGQGFVPETIERGSFFETILDDQLRNAIRSINDPDEEWLADNHIDEIIHRIDQLHAADLLVANQQGTAWLQNGIEVDIGEEGVPDHRPVKLIDFDQVMDRNSFVAIRQFRVQPLVVGNAACEPDIVLFVNGIPIVVIECKRPDRRNLLRDAIRQLLRYQNMRVADDPYAEGVPELFRFCQITVGTTNNTAKYGTIGTRASRYLDWKDTHPFTENDAMALLGREDGDLSPQEILAVGMLNPTTLVDLVQNYVGFEESVTGTKKIVPRYVQYRAADLAIRRLLNPPELPEWEGEGEDIRPDPRGGYVWHTQGSGKSLTMAWIAQKMQSNPDFAGWKIVYMTDRTSLEDQLSETPAFKDLHIRVADNVRQLQEYLSDDNAGIIFGMVQKMQDTESRLEAIENEQEEEYGAEDTRTALVSAQDAQAVLDTEIGEIDLLNEDPSILVIVDEGHRSHTNLLHANLRQALPNSAMIAFTGTPILSADGSRPRTARIFGSRIDVYPIDQAQDDGVILPIDYEGRQSCVNIIDGLDDNMNAQLEQEISEIMNETENYERTVEERVDAARREFFTRKPILTDPDVVRMKARDILRHYVRSIMTNHCKGQLVAANRETAVLYQAELGIARDNLLEEVDADYDALVQVEDIALDEIEDEDQITLIMAARNRELVARLEFGAVISHGHNDEAHLTEWSRPSRIDEIKNQFKLPLVDEEDEENQHGMAIVCVTRMLTTGFSNKITQAIYLDRPMEGHELLQTIARVNRIYAEKNKVAGHVIDYCGLGERLLSAYEMYTQGGEEEEIEVMLEGAIITRLEAALEELQEFFANRNIPEISTPEHIEECVVQLEDSEVRAEFREILSRYLRLFERVAFRPEVRAHRRTTKVYGFISRLASNVYGEDEDLVIADLGEMVQGIIRNHVEPNCIRPRIRPVRIGDDAFTEYVEELRNRNSRSRAAFMRNAIDHYITIHFEENPAEFGSIQERLERAVEEYGEQWDDLANHLEELASVALEGNPRENAPVPAIQVRFLDILNNPEDPGIRPELDPATLEQNIVLLNELWPILQHHAELQGIHERVGQETLRKEIFRHLPLALSVEQRRRICEHFVLRTIRNIERLRDA